MRVTTFTVFPGGNKFYTSDLDQTVGDTSHAYLRAHLWAAEQAAERKMPHYVLSSKFGERRMGFGNHRATVLQDILGLALSSYWDFTTDSWVPLEEDTRTLDVTEELFA